MLSFLDQFPPTNLPSPPCAIRLIFFRSCQNVPLPNPSCWLPHKSMYPPLSIFWTPPLPNSSPLFNNSPYEFQLFLMFGKTNPHRKAPTSRRPFSTLSLTALLMFLFLEPRLPNSLPFLQEEFSMRLPNGVNPLHSSFWFFFLCPHHPFFPFRQVVPLLKDHPLSLKWMAILDESGFPPLSFDEFS